VSLSSSQKKSLEQAVSEYEQYLHLAGSYLDARGIGQQVARTFRLGVVAEPMVGHDSYVNRLVIPYLTRAGISNLKFRCIDEHDCKAVDCAKYLGLHKVTRLYNVNDFFTDRGYIALTEGEIDGLVLSGLADVPAVGFPGATQWKRHYERCFYDFEKVYVFADGDQAGKDFAKRVADHIDGVVTVQMPNGMDVNEVYLAEGRDGLRARAGL
jgi:DNA primase